MQRNGAWTGVFFVCRGDKENCFENLLKGIRFKSLRVQVFQTALTLNLKLLNPSTILNLKRIHMKAITKDYLVDIIYRVINKTIDVHRRSKKNRALYEQLPTATDEEILDFIHSIPYFDERLKNFLVGNLADKTIIVSQSWEIEFLKKTLSWAESFEWLQGNDYFLSDAHTSSIKMHTVFLSLPY